MGIGEGACAAPCSSGTEESSSDDALSPWEGGKAKFPGVLEDCAMASFREEGVQIFVLLGKILPGGI